MDNRRKAWEFKKNTYFCFTDYLKFLTVLITTNWEILIEMGIPDHLICTWVKKLPLEPYMEYMPSSKLGKKYIKAVYCHPVYLTYM